MINYIENLPLEIIQLIIKFIPKKINVIISKILIGNFNIYSSIEDISKYYNNNINLLSKNNISVWTYQGIILNNNMILKNLIKDNDTQIKINRNDNLFIYKYLNLKCYFSNEDYYRWNTY